MENACPTLVTKFRTYDEEIQDLRNKFLNSLIYKKINLWYSKNFEEKEEDEEESQSPYEDFDVDSTYILATVFKSLKSQKYDEAIDDCRAVVSQSVYKDMSLVYALLAIAYFNKENLTDAVTNYKEAINLQIENFDYHYQLGLCYEKQLEIIDNNEKEEDNGEENKEEKVSEIHRIIEEIKENYKKAIELNPNSPYIYLNLGKYCIRDGFIDSAKKYWTNAESICKTEWRIYNNLAVAYYKENSYKLAADNFGNLFKLNEDKMDLDMLKAYLHCLTKCESNTDYTQMEKISKIILKKDKSDKKALVCLVESLKNNKKYEEAFELLRKIKNKLKKLIESNEINIKDNKNIVTKKFKELKKNIKTQIKEVKSLMKTSKVDKTKEKTNLDDIAKLDQDNLDAFGFKKDVIDEVLALYREDKNDLDALYNLALINFKEEDFVKSEEFFTRVYNLDPEFEKNVVYECLGDINLNVHNKPKEALEYFETILPNLPETENGLLRVKIGICYETMNQNDKALEYYMEAYKQNPEFANAIFHIGCIYDKKENESEAKKYLEMSYDKEKENVDYLQKYGDILVRSNNNNEVSKGILILEKGIEFFTGNIEIIASLAKGYEKQGRLKDALNLLEQANNSPEFYNNKCKVFQLACYYEKTKDLTKAIQFFKNVLHLDKNNIEALLHIGYIYKNTKENVKAFKCFKQILKLQPNNYFAHYGIGRLLQSINHDAEAIESYNKCLEINPKFFKAHLQLGIIHLKQGKFDDSLDYLKVANNLERENTLCLVAIGNVYLEQRDYQNAKSYLNEALKKDKKNVAANAALADVLFSDGKVSEAITKYKEVNKLNCNIPEMYLHLGHCYFIEEEFNLAVTNYKEALKLVRNTRHDYYFFLGNALVASHKINDAIVAYQAAIKIRGTKLKYYYAEAKACFLAQKYTRAIKVIEKFLELYRSNKYTDKIKGFTENDVHHLLFKCYSYDKNPDYIKCHNLIKALVKAEPSNVKFLESLAEFQKKNKKTTELLKTIEQILELDNTNKVALEFQKEIEEEENFDKKKSSKKSNYPSKSGFAKKH